MLNRSIPYLALAALLCGCPLGYTEPVDGCGGNVTTTTTHEGGSGGAAQFACECHIDAPNMVASCNDDGSCAFDCVAGWADCDGITETGCESNLALADNCGSCGVMCASPWHCAKGCNLGESFACHVGVNCEEQIAFPCDSADHPKAPCAIGKCFGVCFPPHAVNGTVIPGRCELPEGCEP